MSRNLFLTTKRAFKRSSNGSEELQALAEDDFELRHVVKPHEIASVRAEIERHSLRQELQALLRHLHDIFKSRFS